MADVAALPRRSLVQRLRQLWRGAGGTGVGVFYLGGNQGIFMGQAWDFTRVAQTVYANPTGYRCVTAIESNFSRPPWLLLPPDSPWPRASSEIHGMPEHPLLGVLNRPNDGMSATMFQRAMARDLELSGRSFWMKMQGRDGWGNAGPVSGLRRMPPQRVTVVGNQDDELVGFVYTDRQGRQYPALPNSVVFLRYPHPERAFDGMPPALIAGLPSELDTQGARFNYDLLRNDSGMPGYLVLKGMTPDQFQDWKTEWETSSQTGKTRFISAEQASYEKVGQTNQELTYSELRDDSQDDIMRAFGVPRAVAFDVSREALALDTPLPTPEGWTTVGDVAVGDRLFDDLGQLTRVVATTPVYESRRCYEVGFSDGTKIVADAGHLWQVMSLSGRNAAYHYRRGNTKREPAVMELRTTEQIAQNHRVRNGRNYRIANCAALDMASATLPLDPYVLGAWVGDGFTGRPTICGTEDDLAEIMREVAARGYALGKVSSQGNTFRQGFGKSRGSGEGQVAGAAATLTRMGVYQAKAIPAEYLRGSVEQRLDLLRGLMDTDGHCTRRGRCSFSTVKRDLAWQVHELVTSLGMRPHVYETRSRLRDRDCGPAFSVEFMPNRQVFGLRRKAERVFLREFTGRQASKTHYRTIAAVREVESVAVRCIEVDSPTHLFLCSRAMIPTHNTYANAEREQAIFMQHNILPKWVLICDELTLQLGDEANPSARVALDLTSIDELQDSRDALVERAMKELGMKASTINEYRISTGREAVPWGDEPVAPEQPMSPIPLQPGGDVPVVAPEPGANNGHAKEIPAHG